MAGDAPEMAGFHGPEAANDVVGPVAKVGPNAAGAEDHDGLCDEGFGDVAASFERARAEVVLGALTERNFLVDAAVVSDTEGSVSVCHVLAPSQSNSPSCRITGLMVRLRRGKSRSMVSISPRPCLRGPFGPRFCGWTNCKSPKNRHQIQLRCR